MLLSGVVDDLAEAIVGLGRVINWDVGAGLLTVIGYLIFWVILSVKTVHIFGPRWSWGSLSKDFGAVMLDLVRESDPVLIHVQQYHKGAQKWSSQVVVWVLLV